MPRVLRIRNGTKPRSSVLRSNSQRRRQVRAQMRKTNCRRRALFLQSLDNDTLSAA